jgi:hypothetical protein
VKVCAESHSLGSATHAPVPSEKEHQPQPATGVHDPHDRIWLQES